MKRRPAARRHVGVRSTVEEIRGELEVRIAGGEQEGVKVGFLLFPLDAPGRFHRAHGKRFVEPRAGIEQSADGLDVALACGKQQRRKAALRSGTDGGAGPGQRAHYIGVAFGGSPHQGRLMARRLARLDGCAAGQQRIDGCDAAGTGGRHQRGLSRWQRHVRIRARGKEDCDDCRIATLTRERQWPDAVTIGRVHTRAGSNQRLSKLGVVAVRGPVQCRCAVRLDRIDVGALLQFGAGNHGIAAPNRINQRRRAGALDDRHRRPDRQDDQADRGLRQPHRCAGAHSDSGSDTMPARPVLSTKLSRRTPTPSSNVR